jgi:anti-sigma factor ChrR (cupin superfamily)
MHLRGLLKQCEAAFEDHVLYKQLQDMLEEILALEDQAIANRNTRTAVVQ